MRFLGTKTSKSSKEFDKFLLKGEMILEIGEEVYAASQDDFCPNCDGCGCKSCKFTGNRVEKAKKKKG